MTLPLVSAVIPAFRHERFLGECLESLLAQTYTPLELLLVDDASPDGTFRTAEGLRPQCEARFARTVMLSKPKENAAASINMALEMARGEYVYLIASDDAAEPHAVEELVQAMEARPDAVLAVGDNLIMDANSRRIGWDEKRRAVPLGEAPFKTFGDFLGLNGAGRHARDFGAYPALLKGNHIPNGCLMRASALRAVGGYDTSVILEDWYINLQLAKLGPMLYLPKILFRYRWHGSNTIKNYEDEEIQRKICRQICQREEPYCQEHDLLPLLRRKDPDTLRNRWHWLRRKVLKVINRVFYLNLAKRKGSFFGREFRF